MKQFTFTIKVKYGFVEDDDPVFKTRPLSDEREQIYREWIEELVHDHGFEIVAAKLENQEETKT